MRKRSLPMVTNPAATSCRSPRRAARTDSPVSLANSSTSSRQTSPRLASPTLLRRTRPAASRAATAARQAQNTRTPVPSTSPESRACTTLAN
ncbi:MAG: hypothetical protein AB7O66_12030 [Limisphaerales bacterium]